MNNRLLRRRLPPRISTPEFWPATFDRFDEILAGADHCQVEHIGTSAGGRAIHGVTRRGRSDGPTLGLVGGAHGHQPQGSAICLNVVSVLGYGRDLKGSSWPQIVDDLSYVIVPVLNPDARARMPNAFVGLARQDVLHYGDGITLEGTQHAPGDDGCDPDAMMILGGRFNDAGHQLSREGDAENIQSPEVAAAMRYMADHQPDVVLELEGHAGAPRLVRPDHDLPEDARERQQTLCEGIVARCREEGIELNITRSTCPGLSTRLYHHVAGAAPLLYEGPQGLLDSDAAWSHEQIIDTAMSVVSALVAQLMEG